MKRHMTIAFGLVLALTSFTAMAQMSQPTTGPELKKLDYFIGTWSGEATVVPGPWGAGGKFSDTVTSEWMKGNFYVVGRSDFSLPQELGGVGTDLTILGYDADKKVYTEDRFYSNGRHMITTGTLNGDIWTWIGQSTYNGMTIESRMTIKVVSPTAFTSKYEISADGGATWMPFWDGKETKH